MKRIVFGCVISLVCVTPFLLGQDAQRGQSRNKGFEQKSEKRSTEDVEELEEFILNEMATRRKRRIQEIEKDIEKRSFSGFLYSIGRGGYFRVVFLVSLNLLFLSFLFLILSHIGGFEFPVLVTGIASAVLLISLIPVLVGVASLFIGIQNYLMILTVMGWLSAAGIISAVFMQRNADDQKLIDQGVYWRCPKCKAFNEQVYARCTVCDTKKE